MGRSPNQSAHRRRAPFGALHAARPVRVLPLFKLALSGNSLPTLHNCGAAMRRRFNLVPFDQVPEDVDTELADKLRLNGRESWRGQSRAVSYGNGGD